MSAHSTRNDQPLEGKVVEDIPLGLRDATKLVPEAPKDNPFPYNHVYQGYYGYHYDPSDIHIDFTYIPGENNEASTLIQHHRKGHQGDQGSAETLSWDL